MINSLETSKMMNAQNFYPCSFFPAAFESPLYSLCPVTPCPPFSVLSIFPWLLPLNFSTVLEAATFFYPSTPLHLYAICLECPFPSYLPSKLPTCLLFKTQLCGPFLCDASHRIVHPFPLSPEALAPSSGEDGEWKEKPGQVSAAQASNFNTVSLTPNSLVPVTFHPLGSWLHF